jgi:hypothetical protein
MGPIPGTVRPVHETSPDSKPPCCVLEDPNAHGSIRINRIHKIAQLDVSMVRDFCECADRGIGFVRGPVGGRERAPWVLDEVCERSLETL